MLLVIARRGLPRTSLTSLVGAAVLSGLASAGVVRAAPARAAEPSAVVINEIHYDPADKRPHEFVELHNASGREISLAGWTLEKFTFPTNARLAAGGFVIVAQDPAVFTRDFGAGAWGPLSGRLSNGGEKLTLRDADGKVVDEVKYGVGFPWPTAANGAGSSLERVHPRLPSSHPASWRSAGFPVVAPDRAGPIYIPAGDARWRWRKGTNEASVPMVAWRWLKHVEDASWQTGALPLGYEDDDDRTVLTDMEGRYSSIFLRRTFVLTNPVPAAMLLRVRVDDGCIAWLNGREVARLHMRGGDIPFDGVGVSHEAGEEFEEVMLEGVGTGLKVGTNLLAVQVFNASVRSTDLTIDVELRAPEGAPRGRRPTPGATNSVFSPVSLPAVGEVRHEPAQPRSGEPVVVTAKVSAPEPLKEVVLRVQVVEPGEYIPRTSPAYRTGWSHRPMRDDGREGDVRAKDGIYTVVLADTQQHRRLVRYQVAATDAAGRTVQVPYADDAVANFAWFVYDGIPGWAGARRPGRTPAVTYSPEFLQTIPPYHLLARAADVARSQWDSGANRRRFSGTLVCDGVVYDAIEFHNRGTGSAFISGKNKWGFKFARGHELAARSMHGRPWAHRWDSLNLNPGLSTPYGPVHAGIAGLDEALTFRAYQLAGVPAANTHWIQFRIVDSPGEASPTNQYAGDLRGLYLAIQDMDGSLLRERGLPDGNIYSIQSGRKHLARGAPLDGSDWSDFLNGIRSGRPEAWWRTNLDLAAYYSFQAISRVVGNVDLRPDGNHGYYRRPDGRWAPFPWDHDMMFVPRVHQPGQIDAIRCLQVPALKLEYRNRAREILDLFCADATPDGGQVGQLVAELSGVLRPAGFTNDWGQLDAAVWDWNPRQNQKGIFYVNPARGQHGGGGWTRTLASADLAGFCRYLVEFATDARPVKNYAPNDGDARGYGYGYLLTEARDARIPDRPVIQPLGSGGGGGGGGAFALSPFVSPVTNRVAAMQWRVGAIGGPGGGRRGGEASWSYELEPYWMSGELAPEAVFQPPAEAWPRGRTARLRARYKDHTGRWSHWSEAIERGPEGPEKRRKL